MDTTVKQLVERFNDGTATPEERLALLQMVQAGQHTELFGDDFEARFLYYLERPHLLNITDEEDQQATILEQQSRDKVLQHTGPATISLYPYWRMAAVAAAVLIFITVSFYFYKEYTSQSDTLATTQTTAQPGIFKGRQWIHLPDGSTVLLNDNSELRYEASFNTTTRTVTLTGEAYFDVKHDPTKPFNVQSGTISTHVLGTAFNVKAYPNQKDIIVTVTRGKVKVTDTKQELATITPDQQLSVNATDTRVFKKETLHANANETLTWKSSFLVFDGIYISDAIRQISEKFNVTITLTNPAFNNCRIDAAFLHNEDLDQILNVISKVYHGSYTHSGTKATITGSCE